LVTAEQVEDFHSGIDVVLTDEILERIDAIVPPGTDVGILDQAYPSPSNAVLGPSASARRGALGGTVLPTSRSREAQASG
jgi:hypothetical protein